MSLDYKSRAIEPSLQLCYGLYGGGYNDMVTRSTVETFDGGGDETAVQTDYEELRACEVTHVYALGYACLRTKTSLHACIIQAGIFTFTHTAVPI